jgi:predicted unusual protein kinase regulating ubiquinone biosynthesis (AarF/ABC1/UbiB family)
LNNYTNQIYLSDLVLKFLASQVLEKKSLDSKSVGLRLVKALEELGPTFIKLGQFLGTRPDIVGKDLAIELQSLQMIYLRLQCRLQNKVLLMKLVKRNSMK